MGAFHGKTMGALSATWDKKYREPFMPLVPEIKHVAPDNADKIREAITEKTAAIIMRANPRGRRDRVPPDGYLQQVEKSVTIDMFCLSLMKCKQVLDAQANYSAAKTGVLYLISCV